MLVRESHLGCDGASLVFDEAECSFAFAILHRCGTTVGLSSGNVFDSLFGFRPHYLDGFSHEAIVLGATSFYVK